MTDMKEVPDRIARAGRRTTIILLLVQSLVSAGSIATATVLSILGEQLSDSAAWAGVPSAAIQIFSAPFAYFWG